MTTPASPETASGSDPEATPSQVTGGEGAARRSWWPSVGEGLLIVIIALTLNLAGNGQIGLWDRDEPRYAGCTREMLQSGDLIHPTFNAEPRYHKPVLIYWLMCLGVQAGGDNPFGTRLVSSIAGAMTTLVTWFFARSLLGVWPGRFTAMVLLSAPLMIVESKFATTDATLTLLLVGCQFCLWKLRDQRSLGYSQTFWVLLALTVLIKGPVGPAYIATSWLASLAFKGPGWTWRNLRLRYGLPTFLMITLPWYIAIGFRSGGEFYQVALGYHVVERVSRGIEGHGGFPGYYLVLTAGTFFPWSALVPLALWQAFRKRKTGRQFGFLMGWVLGPLVMLECVGTKLIHYYLPSIPALAMVIGWSVNELRLFERDLRMIPLGRLAVGMIAGMGLVLAAVLLAGSMAFPWMRWSGLLLGIILGAGTFLAVSLMRQGRILPAASLLSASWSIILLGLGAWLVPAADPYRISDRVGKRLAELSQAHDAQPILARFDEPAVVYGLGRPAPVAHGRQALTELITEHDRIVAALSEDEIRLVQEEMTDVALESAGSISGFNINKGRQVDLQFVILEREPGVDDPGVAETIVEREVSPPAPSAERIARGEAR